MANVNVKTIKASSDGKPRLLITQGENKIRIKVPQARTLAAIINRKFGKSLAFVFVVCIMTIVSHAQQPPTGLKGVVVGKFQPTIQVDKLKATTTTTHSVTLTVTPAGGGTVTGYNFLRSTTTGGPYTLLSPGTSTTTSYVDTQSLVEGTTYYYVAEATGPGGTSSNSPQATATIPFLPPGIPSGLSAAAQ